jgi:hypothetical protein
MSAMTTVDGTRLIRGRYERAYIHGYFAYCVATVATNTFIIILTPWGEL